MSADKLFQDTLNTIMAALPEAERLLLVWILREHEIEAKMLREELDKIKNPPNWKVVVDEILSPEEAVKRVNELLDETEEKPAETVDRSDTSGGKVEENPAEATQPADKGACPYDLDLGMPAGEARRIKACVEVARTSLEPWQFCRVVELRLKNATPTQIAEAIDVKPSVIGPQLRAADKHIKELAVHPREGWRSHYLRELWDHIERQRR